MGRLLTAIGVLLVLVFVGAASAPFLIDWNKQKPLFEAEARRVLGIPVLVDGRMELNLLPSPVLRLESVRLGGPGAEARIGSVHLELSVGALVRGQIDVVQARLMEPKVWIGLDREGRFSGQGLQVDMSAVSLRRVEVEDGEITVEDPREGTRLFVTQLAFGGEAGSLVGPWRLEGGGRFDGQRANFTLQTGRAEAGNMRVRMGFEPLDRPVAVDIDGELAWSERRPVLTGQARLRGLGAADAAARDTGWRAEASIELRPERLVATNLKMVPANANERVLEFTGSANMALGQNVRLDAALALRQLDLDRLAGVAPNEPEADVAVILRRVANLPALLAVPAAEGRVSLDVGSIVLAGGLLQDVAVRLELSEGRVRLTQADARLPGQGTLKASGVMGLRGGPLLFDGPIELAVRAPGTFASWLEGELLRPRKGRGPPPPGGITVSGRLAVGPDRLSLTGLSAQAGGAAVTGEVDFARGADPSRLRVRLGTSDMDLEPLGALVAALAPRVRGLDIGEVDATLRADRLRYRALEARGLNVAIRAGVEGVMAESLSATLNGVALSGAGRLDPDGRGAMRLRLAGQRTGPLVDALIEAFGEHPALRALASRAAALGAIALDATITRQGAGLDVAVAGTAGGTRLEAGAAFDRLATTAEALQRLNVTAQNDRASALLAQIGTDPTGGDVAPARVTFTLQRAPNAQHRLTVDADVAGTRVAATGNARVTPEGVVADSVAVAASSGDAGPLLALLGHPLLEAADRLPVSLRGRLALSKAQVTLSALDGQVGGETVRGNLELTREAVPRIGGKLTLGSVALDRVAALVMGPWPEEAGTGWPRAAFGPRPLPPMAGAVTIESPRFDMGRFAVTQANFALRVGEGGLAVEGLTGLLAGGRLQGELVLSRPDGGVRVTGRATLTGARLEDLVWQRDGRPVASGRSDLRLVFEGQGRTPAVLVSSLTGEGSLNLTNGEIRGVATTGFSAGMRASEAGLDLDEARLSELVRREMDAGALPFERLDTAFTLQGGVIRATNLTLNGAPVAATGRVAFDLPRWTVDADWTLEGDAGRPGARGPRIGLTFVGPIETPERRIDVRAFVDLLNLRRFEREVERLEALQREIEERERVLREIERQEEIRRERALRELERRARESQQPAPAAPDPAPQPQTAPAPAQSSQAPPAAAAPEPRTVLPSTPTDAERARFNAIIEESLRGLPPAAPAGASSPPSEAPAAETRAETETEAAAGAPPVLAPLPPPIVIAPAPGAGRNFVPQQRGPLPLQPLQLQPLPR